jgi:hypothetical protein
MFAQSGANWMKVSILGVLVGGFVDIVSSMFAAVPFFVYARIILRPSHPIGRLPPHAVSDAIRANILLYSAQVIIGLLCSILGGYVAAAIARRHERLNGTLSSYLCVSLGTVSMFVGLTRDPIWLQTLLLITGPVMAFMGGDLRLRQRLARAAKSGNSAVGA